MSFFLDDDLVNLEILGGDFLPESIKRRQGSQIREIRKLFDSKKNETVR